MCKRPIHDKAHITTIVAWVTGGSAALAVLLRIIGNINEWPYRIARVCALGAGIGVVAMNAAQLHIDPTGFGRDVWMVQLKNLVLIQKVSR
jgi:hypothetical protein